jgi:proton-dependent oligopeptide transporter, POT family
MISLFKQQPRAFFMIFMLEIWERFGYYTVQGILAYYFVKVLGFSDDKAFYTFGAFSALVYGLVAFGGFLGDKIFGTKRTIVLGIVTLALGYLSLAFADEHTVFLALGLVCVGNGLFKANPSSLLAKCYQERDPRLHGAFTLYYMAINMGSIGALFLGPLFSEKFGWSYAFFLSFIGLILALVNYWYYRHTVADIHTPADDKPFSWILLNVIVIGIIGTTIASAYLLQHVSVAKKLVWVITALVTATFFKYLLKENGASRKRMAVAFVLMVEAIVFFTLYQQMPTSLNFFAIHNVDHHLLGIAINPQSFQALNPIWIMLMSPVLAMAYLKSHQKGVDFSTPHKFAFGMTLCGISFAMLYFSRYFADSAGIVSSWWLVGSYFFQSTGELLVSALGVAMVAELVPASITGFIMGMWFLTSSIAGFTGAAVASLTAPPEGVRAGIETLNIYTHVFLQIGLCALALSAIMWLIAPRLANVIKRKSSEDESYADELEKCSQY